MGTKGTCSVDWCERQAQHLGLCGPHYHRQREYGTPLAGGTFRGEPKRFMMEVAVNYTGDDCLIWPYSRDRHGYGQININGTPGKVSRHVCRIVHGEPPTRKHHAAHSCGKGHLGCVNPRHLSWKTCAENAADKALHGTQPRGERQGAAKLTEEQAIKIFQAKGKVSKKALAEKYGVSYSSIWLIQNKVNWRYIHEGEAS